MPNVGWTITCWTPSGTEKPKVQTAALSLAELFGETVTNVNIAGPQSVDDSPVEVRE